MISIIMESSVFFLLIILKYVMKPSPTTVLMFFYKLDGSN